MKKHPRAQAIGDFTADWRMVPIAALAFLATWFIPQVELKRWPETPAAAAPEAEMAMASVTVAPKVQTQEVPAQQTPTRAGGGASDATDPRDGPLVD